MDAVLRAAVTYFFVLLVFRIAGKRSLAELSTFDFVLLLIISETTQAALVANDNSLTNTFILIATLVGLDIALSIVKQKSKLADTLIDSLPVVVLANGIPIQERMDRCRVDESDILAAARMLMGLERLDQIKYAVLERNGGISIIPIRKEEPPAALPPSN